MHRAASLNNSSLQVPVSVISNLVSPVVSAQSNLDTMDLPSNIAATSDTPPSTGVPALVPSSSSQNAHSMVTRSKSGIFRHKHPFVGAVISSEPRSVKAALADPDWRLAMQNDFNALMRNNTWTLVPPTPSQHVVSNK